MTSLVAGKGDSAAAAKFCKLMGIQGDLPASSGSRSADLGSAVAKGVAQADLFQRLEHEYEVSRTLTHTQRGVGLGFASARLGAPAPQPPPSN